MNELRIKNVSFSTNTMRVEFSDGQGVSIPVESFPRLNAASRDEREQWQLIGRGLGVHWELLDEDLSVENILFAYAQGKASEYAHVSHA